MGQLQCEEMAQKFQPLMKLGLELTVLKVGNFWGVQLVGKKAPRMEWSSQKGVCLFEYRDNDIYLWVPFSKLAELNDVLNARFLRMKDEQSLIDNFCAVWGPVLFCSSLEMLLVEDIHHEYP